MQFFYIIHHREHTIAHQCLVSNRNRSRRRRPFRIVSRCINIFVSRSKLFRYSPALCITRLSALSSSYTSVIICFQELSYAFFLRVVDHEYYVPCRSKKSRSRRETVRWEVMRKLVRCTHILFLFYYMWYFGRYVHAFIIIILIATTITIVSIITTILSCNWSRQRACAFNGPLGKVCI